jgi:hypothetical protein
MEFRAFEQVGRNLYRTGSGYWRLAAIAVSPNGCWLLAPKMVELQDIDTASGTDILGSAQVVFDVCGTVPACYEFLSY